MTNPPAKIGDRIRITGPMPGEPDPIPVGTEGTVDWVGQWTDELTKQIGVRWDNGRRLILLAGDPYEVLPQPRIDVVVVRHPDYETSVTTYLNGQPVEVHEWSFDPGAGYGYEDYCEMRDEEVAAAPDFLKDVIAQTYADMRDTFEKWTTDTKPWPAD